MSSLKEVLVVGRETLIPDLRRHGFSRYRTSYKFVRCVGDIYHVLSFVASRWGGSYYVYVHAWVPEIEEPGVVTKKNFSKMLDHMVTGGRLSPRAVGSGAGDHSWDYGENEAETARIVGELIHAIN